MTFKRTFVLLTVSLAVLTVLPAFSSSSTAAARDWDDYWEDRYDDDYYEDLREAREDYYEDLYDDFDDDDFRFRRYTGYRYAQPVYHAARYRGAVYHSSGYTGMSACSPAPVHGCCHVGHYQPAPVVHHHDQGCCTPAPQTCCAVFDD